MNDLKKLLSKNGLTLLLLAALLWILFEVASTMPKGKAVNGQVTPQADDQSNGIGDFTNPNMTANTAPAE